MRLCGILQNTTRQDEAGQGADLHNRSFCSQGVTSSFRRWSYKHLVRTWEWVQRDESQGLKSALEIPDDPRNLRIRLISFHRHTWHTHTISGWPVIAESEVRLLQFSSHNERYVLFEKSYNQYIRQLSPT